MNNLRCQLKIRGPAAQAGGWREFFGLPLFVVRSSILLPLCLGLLFSAGCDILEREPRILSHAQPSAEALAEQVLEGLARQDQQSLRELVLTKEEFCTYVWPELPSSKVKNMTCDWVWNLFEPIDTAGLQQTLARYGGEKYALVRVRFAKGTTEYDTFKVHNNTRMVVKDRAGQEKEIKLGSMLEMDGQFKLFSFIVD